MDRARSLGRDAALAPGLRQVIGEAEGGPDEDPVARRLQRVEGALVRVVGVIDDLDAVAQGEHDRLRAPAVCGDAQARL